MKLEKYIFYKFLLLLLTFHSSVNSQLLYRPGDTLYVIAGSGLNMRNSPDRNSDIISVLKNGDQVIAQSFFNIGVGYDLIIKDRQKLEYDKSVDIDIYGNWILVSSNQDTGYVFSGYLSSYNLEKIKGELKEIYNCTFIDYLKILHKDEKYIYNEIPITAEFKKEIISFENGLTYINYHYPSGNESILTIPNVSLFELYFMIRVYDSFAIDIKQGSSKSITIHQELGGYQFFTIDFLSVIKSGWSCK
ncbi:hypothetical protein CEQ90_19225 [Lewinellaceae bacterium SD302]|nr:hypothetical protein CEQ90_19225 [Lewinellaceae bacterium SD302]